MQSVPVAPRDAEDDAMLAAADAAAAPAPGIPSPASAAAAAAAPAAVTPTAGVGKTDDLRIPCGDVTFMLFVHTFSVSASSVVRAAGKETAPALANAADAARIEACNKTGVASFAVLSFVNKLYFALLLGAVDGVRSLLQYVMTHADHRDKCPACSAAWTAGGAGAAAGVKGAELLTLWEAARDAGIKKAEKAEREAAIKDLVSKGKKPKVAHAS